MPGYLRKYIAIVIDKHRPGEPVLQANGVRDGRCNVAAYGSQRLVYNKQEIQTIRAYLKRNAN
jgi:hypothetical protein